MKCKLKDKKNSLYKPQEKDNKNQCLIYWLR